VTNKHCPISGLVSGVIIPSFESDNRVPLTTLLSCEDLDSENCLQQALLSGISLSVSVCKDTNNTR